jgi:hypothetical protein
MAARLHPGASSVRCEGPNANHDGDKPAKQDPIDSLTNDSTSRGRFELRVRCRAAHHAVAAAATSFGLAMSPWSAVGPTHRASSDLVAARLCRAYRRLAVPGDDQQRLAFGRSTPWRRQWTQPAVTASPTSTTATPASRAERQIWRGVASLIGTRSVSRLDLLLDDPPPQRLPVDPQLRRDRSHAAVAHPPLLAPLAHQAHSPPAELIGIHPRSSHRLHPPCTEWSLRRTRGASCAGRSRTSAQNARREAPTVWRLCPER